MAIILSNLNRFSKFVRWNIPYYICSKWSLLESSSEKNVNRFIFDIIMAMSLWTHFFGPPCRPIHTTKGTVHQPLQVSVAPMAI